MAVDKEDRRNEEIAWGKARVGEIGSAAVAMPLIPLRREVRGRGARRSISMMANLRRGWRFVKQNEPGGIQDPGFLVPENGSRIGLKGRRDGYTNWNAGIHLITVTSRFPTGRQQGCLLMEAAVFADFSFVHWAVKYFRVLEVGIEIPVFGESMIFDEAAGQGVASAVGEAHFAALVVPKHFSSHANLPQVIDALRFAGAFFAAREAGKQHAGED